MKRSTAIISGVVGLALVAGVGTTAYYTHAQENSINHAKYAKDKDATDYRNGVKTGKTYNLDFSKLKYKTKTLTINNKKVKVREYTNVVYTAKPVDTKYESMNIYIPEAYFQNKKINGYTKDTAPIFMPNTVGGYMSATAATIDHGNTPSPNAGQKKSQAPAGNGANLNQNGGASSGNAMQEALSKGFVVVSAGARGRDSKVNGKYSGAAPATVVDLKAAVRYLKLNDKKMAGDANKIIADGTSAGGAMSALLASTGNNKDYYPYLKAIGAADTSDNIFATYSFAPITNLDNADSAYEWEFNGVNTVTSSGMPGASTSSSTTELTDKQKKMSTQLKSSFVTYINNLGLKDDNGKKLTLKKDGTGSFSDFVKQEVIDSANAAIKSGTSVTTEKYPWLTIKDGKATDVDMTKYFASIGRMKTPTAFDSVDLSAAENQIMGTSTTRAKHFTSFGMKNNTKSGATMADSSIIKMMNPMNYIGKSGTTMAKHYYIRYGGKDANTSVAIPTILAQKLKNAGVDVDYKVKWDTGHSGDYDMDDMFKWAEKITK
ncbi:subtype B tannase [Eupransor demetentiae]|uniref:Acetyl esterase/lipase (Aes) n=1 Tax=Eupransor demetentiae TaxID=3109584 RepID=A0ABP0EQ44_9LACO|nr:Acetyl esterase/lipase (Aes) [Lactobacillaceae bacterium LMG 33000]